VSAALVEVQERGQAHLPEKGARFIAVAIEPRSGSQSHRASQPSGGAYGGKSLAASWASCSGGGVVGDEPSSQQA